MNFKKWFIFFWLLWFSNAHSLNAFFKASERGDVQAIIIDPGTIESKNKARFGRTALLMAADKGHLQVVKLLLDNNADIEAVDNSGWNALHLAAFAGHGDVAAYLIDHVKELKIPRPEGVVIHLSANDAKAAKNQRLKSFINSAIGLTNATALHKAAEAGHMPIVILLLAEGADFAAKNLSGETPIHMAGNAKKKNSSHNEIIKALADTSLAKLIATSEADTKIIKLIFKDYPERFIHRFLLEVVKIPEVLLNTVMGYLLEPEPQVVQN